MKWLRKILSLFAGQNPGGEGFWVRVRCKTCGEQLDIRVRPGADLIRGYGDDEPAYTFHKETVDRTCFKPISIHITYDSSMRELTRSVAGGDFIDPHV